jgi:hypothetical protein
LSERAGTLKAKRKQNQRWITEHRIPGQEQNRTKCRPAIVSRLIDYSGRSLYRIEEKIK